MLSVARQLLWQLQPRHWRWKPFTGASQGLISTDRVMLIMCFALHASSSVYCMFNFHTLLHTACTVLVRCFARWKSVRKTLSSWLGDRTPAGCWQISPSHLPSVENLALFLSLRHDISSEGVYSHWPAVLSALPPVHTRCTVARWHHRDRCYRSLLWC